VAPRVQALQVPLPHTMFVPQLVPFATLPVSVQIGNPVEQEMAAVWHGLDDWQSAPGVQGDMLNVTFSLPRVPQSTT
jgi:hypothetical protein